MIGTVTGIVGAISILILLLLFRKYRESKDMKALYQTLLDFYFQSRADGKSPEESCMEAIEKNFQELLT